jgi:PIN domain nuclease of toxin-antitoxin system
MCPPQERVSYGSERSASIFIRASRETSCRDCRFLAPDRNGYGTMTIVAQEALELATLVTKGRIRLDISLESFLQAVESRFVVLPISGRACARAMGLPATYPRDPADRVIAATAPVEGLSLLTADRAIRRSKTVQTIW